MATDHIACRTTCLSEFDDVGVQQGTVIDDLSLNILVDLHQAGKGVTADTCLMHTLHMPAAEEDVSSH
jgi:hypothetical protein